MKNIVEKINDQRIEDAAKKIDELPPMIRARVLGFIEGAVSALDEKKAGENDRQGVVRAAINAGA